MPRPARQLVMARCHGHCERCGWWVGGDIHHRQPKGMGGSTRPDRHNVENLVHLCRRCHSWAHGKPIDASAEGFIVERRSGVDPLDAPVTLFDRRRVYLTPAGLYATEAFRG